MILMYISLTSVRTQEKTNRFRPVHLPVIISHRLPIGTNPNRMVLMLIRSGTTIKKGALIEAVGFGDERQSTNERSL